MPIYLYVIILLISMALSAGVTYWLVIRCARIIVLHGQDDLSREREKLIHETLTPLQEKEKEKLHIVEANVKLLEQQEMLEEQKLRMAEANLKLLELKEEVEIEKDRSEKLLLNILPARVAKDLKEKGESIPESFENVTVFFSDIVNFTMQSSAIDPAEVIRELSDIFTEFDKIFSRNHCERIKTIGDAYLSVSGMPESDCYHYKNILNAALEAINYLNDRNSRAAFKWPMRMGVHSGRVVGGIVGVEKYLYDVFGDAINTAARMEKLSESMRINVSEDTYRLAVDAFVFTHREPMEVKGKGKIKMYFLERAL